MPNHAFALLTDGGDFNGQTVTGIGLTKAFHIYWQAQSVYQVSSSGFTEHAGFLGDSCENLAESSIDLPSLTDGMPSGEIVTTDDCDELEKAIAAVELNAEPECDFVPLLDPDAPPVCLSEAEPIFSESFDSDPGDTWQLTNWGVYDEYTPRDWEWVAEMVGDRNGGFWGEDSLTIGDCTPGSDDQSGVMYLDSPWITVPEGESNEAAVVVFDHYVATEAAFDGGNVWFGVNGGEWQMVKESDFIFNPYNTSLDSEADGNTNPLAGQPAFSGTDEGEVFGSWGQSQVDVSKYAGSGDTVRLRFALGVDGCNGNDGWYLDSVESFFCQIPPPSYQYHHRTNQYNPE